MEDDAPYRAYLVRLWPTRRGGVADYRVTVQSVATSERRCFPDLGSLLAFWQTLRVSPEPGSADGDSEAETASELAHFIENRS